MNFVLNIVGGVRDYLDLYGIHITQYGNYLYLEILLIVLTPAIIMGLCKIRIRVYGIFASLFMITLLIWVERAGMKFFVLFIAAEISLILIYKLIRNRNKNKYIYYLFLLMSMAPLIVSKSAVLFTSTPIGFLGLSYINFRGIQMIIEIYDESIKKVNLFTLIYFLLFFPTLSSGPIDRYRRFQEDVVTRLPIKNYANQFLNNGIRKIVMGIGYKFVLAYIINEYWLSKVPHDNQPLSILSYMYAYSLYLFFDFAGYSNFAIGTSYIFGVKTPENFNMPFISKDMKEFWTRWHISLSRWFGDYIYSRIVLNLLRNKKVKNKHTAGYIAQIITMFTMGAWHGLQPYYLLYGLYQGILLVATDYYQRKSKFYVNNKNRFTYQIASVLITFHTICFGMLIFSGYLFSR